MFNACNFIFGSNILNRARGDIHENPFAQLHAMAYRDAVLNDFDEPELPEPVFDEGEQVAVEKKRRRSGRSGKSGKSGRSNWNCQKKPKLQPENTEDAVAAEEVASCQEEGAAPVQRKSGRFIQEAIRLDESEDEIPAPVEKVDKEVQTLTMRTPWTLIELALCEWQEMQERGIANSPRFFSCRFPTSSG